MLSIFDWKEHITNNKTFNNIFGTSSVKSNKESGAQDVNKANTQQTTEKVVAELTQQIKNSPGLNALCSEDEKQREVDIQKEELKRREENAIELEQLTAKRIAELETEKLSIAERVKDLNKREKDNEELKRQLVVQQQSISKNKEEENKEMTWKDMYEKYIEASWTHILLIFSGAICFINALYLHYALFYTEIQQLLDDQITSKQNQINDIQSRVDEAESIKKGMQTEVADTKKAARYEIEYAEKAHNPNMSALSKRIHSNWYTKQFLGWMKALDFDHQNTVYKTLQVEGSEALAATQQEMQQRSNVQIKKITMFTEDKVFVDELEELLNSKNQEIKSIENNVKFLQNNLKSYSSKNFFISNAARSLWLMNGFMFISILLTFSFSGFLLVTAVLLITHTVNIFPPVLNFLNKHLQKYSAFNFLSTNFSKLVK